MVHAFVVPKVVTEGKKRGEIPPMPLERDEKSQFNFGVCDPLWDIDTLPLTYNDSRWIAFIIEAKMEDLTKIVPKPLEVVDNRIEWWFVKHKYTMLGPYYEMGVTIPCRYRDQETGKEYLGGYYPYMYLTGSAATDAGRVLGFPKKCAYIIFHEHGGDPREPDHKKDFFTCLIARNGYVINSITGMYDDAVKAADISPIFYGKTEWGRFNLKITSNSDLTKTVWELTYLPSEWEGKHRFQLKRETIRTASPDSIEWFGQGTPFDNMCAAITPQKILGAIAFTFDLIIPPAQVLWRQVYTRTPDEVAKVCYATPYRYGMRQYFPKPTGE